ncbi:diaminopimelate decarboxylase [Acetivibrio clariflavus]|uniref:Diaminopimelate decarboxylase n=1 Tax=Acetivibrio clariflavus (strain DSM 19732 / NBRC 101661 / EBR45) TaxID=720554 RepID=G8M210_ACECE|nr:diaminopimelate decarboxylase [Acetivibrio clariflavus]AEV68128.1 diaminopimelate decarboxylase [Acetivibrio clariflavus DSM 19732]
MFVSKALSINGKNHLEIGGCDCVELVNNFGTPLYVLDENLIRENCRLYKNAMDKYYDGNGIVLYASKALSTMAICKIVDQEGLGLDVVSGGELYTALKAGVPMDKIYFHGNNKTYEELEFAISKDIRRIVVDNREELGRINEIAGKQGKVVNISFRIKPGIDAHTHDFVQTGQIDSKFGVALENGEAYEIISEASKMSNVKVVGVHCHIGSQIFDLEPFKLAAKVMLEFIAKVKNEINIEIEELNLGGGFGIKYTMDDDPIEYDHYIESVSNVVKSICKEKGLKLPFIVMEPGRSIVAPAGITLYKVGAVKNIKNVRTYVSVDGGMTDNPRYALYQSKYEAVIANRADAPRVQTVTIAGKCCESGDLLAKDIKMPEIQAGDILAMLATGAYNYSMSSNYNRIPRPPVVLVKDGKARVIVKREDYDDIIRNDVIPEDL